MCPLLCTSLHMLASCSLPLALVVVAMSLAGILILTCGCMDTQGLYFLHSAHLLATPLQPYHLPFTITAPPYLLFHRCGWIPPALAMLRPCWRYTDMQYGSYRPIAGCAHAPWLSSVHCWSVTSHAEWLGDYSSSFHLLACRGALFCWLIRSRYQALSLLCIYSTYLVGFFCLFIALIFLLLFIVSLLCFVALLLHMHTSLQFYLPAVLIAILFTAYLIASW